MLPMYVFREEESDVGTSHTLAKGFALCTPLDHTMPVGPIQERIVTRVRYQS